MIRKLRDTSGSVTRREVLLSVLAIAMCLFFVYEGMRYLDGQQKKGNDALRVNTAESTATINSNDGMSCPVRNCSGRNGSCSHYIGGVYVGYFDDVLNTIVGKKPEGYNEYDTMKVNDQFWHGAPGTMVIRVEVDGSGGIRLSWESSKR